MPTHRLSSLNRMLLVTGALLTAANAASAQAGQANQRHRVLTRNNRPDTIAGQMIVYLQAGTQQADVNRLAAAVQASNVVTLLMADCYRFDLPANKLDKASVAAAVAQLQADPVVRYAGANRAYYALQSAGSVVATPNDPRYATGEQYGLKLINMPQAWALNKGNVKVSVAIIDTGFDPKHEDTPNFSSGSYDIADNDPDITADNGAGPGEFDHGTGTSGVMAAATNNSKGVASVLWNPVPIFALKGTHKGDTVGAFPNDVLLNCYAYIAKNVTAYNIVALNMSYGAQDASIVVSPSDPENVALQNLQALGINCVASAGNDPTGTPILPGDDPGVIKVSATGPNPTTLAAYSNFNNVTIAAPGGNTFGTGRPQDGILVLNQNSQYSFEDGTSFSAPHVTAVLGLLRGVPGVTAALARAALLNQANHTITGQSAVPDPKFGYGLLDAYASLTQVSNLIEISEPVGTDPTTGLITTGAQDIPPIETLRPQVRLHMTNVAIVNGVPQFSVVLTNPTPLAGQAATQPLITNGVDVSGGLIKDLYIQNNSVGAFAQFDVSFRYQAGISPVSQQQQLVATSTPVNTSQTPITATVVYNVTPHSFPAGTSMVSFPVLETASDSPTGTTREIRDLLGFPAVTATATANQQQVSLYRWINTPVVDASGKPSVSGQYAIYGTNSSATSNPLQATLHPTDTTTSAPIATTLTPALDPTVPTTAPSAVVTDYTVTNAAPLGLGYFINLPSGAAVQTFGRTFSQQTVRVPLHEGWNMVGNPYPFAVSFATTAFETSNGTRYNANDAANNKLILPFIYRFVGGGYDPQALPNGTLYPWEGNWIYVTPANSASVSSNPDALTMVFSPTSTGVTSASGRGVKAGTVGGASLRASRAINKPAARGARSWVMRLTGTAGNTADAYNYIGMSSDATPDNVRSRAPKPPGISGNISVGIQSDKTAALYAQDLRPITANQTWTVVAATDQPNTDVAVAWPEIHSVPRGYRLTLTDSVTGQTVDMRSRAAYHFNSGAKPQSRLLTITARQGDTADRVTFNSVAITPRSSGRGVAGALYEIEYNLSGDAQIEVSILNTGGRVIAQVDQGRPVTAGTNRSVWNGRDNQNRALSTGTFIVKMVARTADGKVTQAYHPLIVTR